MNKISPEDSKKLPIGTVLIEASTCNKKEDQQVYCIVTEEGINYFQYGWYKNKYPFDPASYGVGITIEAENTAFIKLDIDPIDIHFREPNPVNKVKNKM